MKNKVLLKPKFLSLSNNVFQPWFLLFLLLWDENRRCLCRQDDSKAKHTLEALNRLDGIKALKELIT